jgi:hypothetical protein
VDKGIRKWAGGKWIRGCGGVFDTNYTNRQELGKEERANAECGKRARETSNIERAWYILRDGENEWLAKKERPILITVCERMLGQLLTISMSGISRISGSTVIRRVVQAGVAFAIGWVVCFVESMSCETAWGGPFTILVSFILKFVFAGLAVGLALVVGLLLLIPGVRDLWQRVGCWSLLISVIALTVMIFASKLGLRTTDPVSNYRMMPFGIWSICLFGIVFPIVIGHCVMNVVTNAKWANQLLHRRPSVMFGS